MVNLLSNKIAFSVVPLLLSAGIKTAPIEAYQPNISPTTPVELTTTTTKQTSEQSDETLAAAALTLGTLALGGLMIATQNKKMNLEDISNNFGDKFAQDFKLHMNKVLKDKEDKELIYFQKGKELIPKGNQLNLSDILDKLQNEAKQTDQIITDYNRTEEWRPFYDSCTGTSRFHYEPVFTPIYKPLDKESVRIELTFEQDFQKNTIMKYNMYGKSVKE